MPGLTLLSCFSGLHVSRFPERVCSMIEDEEDDGKREIKEGDVEDRIKERRMESDGK